jgi:hypothetical protein
VIGRHKTSVSWLKRRRPRALLSQSALLKSEWPAPATCPRCYDYSCSIPSSKKEERSDRRPPPKLSGLACLCFARVEARPGINDAGFTTAMPAGLDRRSTAVASCRPGRKDALGRTRRLAEKGDDTPSNPPLIRRAGVHGAPRDNWRTVTVERDDGSVRRIRRCD